MLGVKSSAVGLIVCADNRGLHMKTVEVAIIGSGTAGLSGREVAIIGSGTAGLSARREVAKKTDNYLLFDGGELGITCARVGCMPSKVLIQATNDFDRRKVFAQRGIMGAGHLMVDNTKVMAFVRNLRDRFVKGVKNDMEDWQDKLVREYVQFIDSHTLKIASGELIHAKKIIIATGSSPVIPQAWQPFSKHIIDTDAFFELPALPRKMIAIGLGVIGIELGQALAKPGVDVTLVGLGKSIGGLSDPVLQSYVANKFQQQMNVYYDDAEIVGIEDNNIIVKIDEQIKHFDKALLVIGRAPNIKGLNLGALQIDLDNKGLPSYDQSTYQLSALSHIYLVGDSNMQRPLLHEAADQGRIAGFNAVAQETQCFAKRVPLAITFSDPNIATIGLTFPRIICPKVWT